MTTRTVKERETHPWRNKMNSAYLPLPGRWRSYLWHASVCLLVRRTPRSSGCHGFQHYMLLCHHSHGFLYSLILLMMHQLKHKGRVKVSAGTLFTLYGMILLKSGVQSESVCLCIKCTSHTCTYAHTLTNTHTHTSAYTHTHTHSHQCTPKHTDTHIHLV